MIKNEKTIKALSLRDVKFSYPGVREKMVLNIPNWSIEAGEQVFLHGPSGGGKSTFLNLLSGILFASQGTVNVLGKQLQKMSGRQRDHFRANHIGYVFQQFNLIPYLNAISNIQLARHFCDQKKVGQLHDEIKNLLSILNITSSDWSKPAAKLSIGQQQRVAIARAFINKPKLLIADEPTSSLDANNRDSFITLLKSLVEKQKTTLIFVSHDLALSKNFDRSQALSDINLASGIK